MPYALAFACNSSPSPGQSNFVQRFYLLDKRKKNLQAWHGNVLILSLKLALTLPFKTLFFFNTFIWVLIGYPQHFLIRPQEAHSCMSPQMQGEAFLRKFQRTSLGKKKTSHQRKNPRQLNPNLYQTHHQLQLSQILNHRKRRKLQFRISCWNSGMNFLMNMEIPRITIP